MKRKGKCVGKRSFAYKSYALKVASNQYKYYGTKVGVYECPTCLDFHLTTKYCNTQKYHRRWLVALAKEMECEYNKLFGKKKRKRKKAQPKQKTKPEMLPLTKQREFWQNYQPKTYPQRQPLWRRIVDIIVVRPVNK